jgi:hypothetical protein
VATLQTLTSLAQGPCPQNQELLAEHPEFLANLDRVMQSDFHPRVAAAWRQDAQVDYITKKNKLCIRSRINVYLQSLALTSCKTLNS